MYNNSGKKTLTSVNHWRPRHTFSLHIHKWHDMVVRNIRTHLSEKSRLIRPVSIGAVGLLMALGLSACSSATKSTTAATKSSASGIGTIYFVSHICPDSPFGVNVDNGVHAAASTLGIHVVLSLPPNDSECGDVSEIRTAFTAALAAKPAGIVAPLLSTTALSTELQRAKNAGIPVVAFNTVPIPHNESQNPYLAYVGQNNFVAGEGAGNEELTQFNLHKGDTVLIINQQPTNVSLAQREDGIKTELQSHGISYSILVTNENPSSGTSIVESYLSAHSGIAGIQTLGVTGSAQALGALKALGKLGTIPVGGFDLDSLVFHYIQSHDMKFTVDQQPFIQGFDSVMELYQLLKWGVRPINIATGPVYLTEHNVALYAKNATYTGF